MTSERIQRRIEQFLDEADDALAKLDWETVRSRAEAVLRIDPENVEARTLLSAAQRDDSPAKAPEPSKSASIPSTAPEIQPTSFANGRYAVSKFLGEGGRKKVYLAHDTLLDRDVAFALIKTEGLDEVGKERVTREAQAMGRLGEHPNNVSVYDIGDESGQPFVVLPLMPGGDVEGEIENAPEHKLPLERVLQIAIDTCQGLAFAHERGILHRDIKPGNVWLATDGRAQVGDWGLAVASDRTRLTQAGMMVGTPTYMPPEQAMGGETTARSDLYSLGAMLYEMVCGRPPFVGDESVAIIGQHLNTPPVAPTWHRPDCPPALEALILRLLEKDPSKRPQSATEVRDALQGIGQPSRGRTQTKAEPVTSPHDHDPLYRRTFVGRENEVRQLQQSFDAAMSGNGSLVMVVGEPGIGKTALCEQLATYVALRGGKALVGHCYEEGSLSLPYLAFVEAMRSYVLAREPEGLRSDLGSGAADVARIVSEVRDRVQGVELRPAGDPEDDRWRLLQAITSFLRNASSVQPLAIVLEDLHWADRGTLDLLLHVARNLSGARLLVVGTYRDVEVDRAHPLSGTLAELRRQSAFSRVPLRGLTIDEVGRMYEAIRGQGVSWAQAEAVHRQTEGNPLFIQEVIRYMVEEGYVVREGGRWVLAEGTVPGTGLPEGLRDVVGKRLSRLSESCNRLLSVAAVIGRDFDLQTLRGIANLSEEELLAGIEEAIRYGVLEERSLPGALRYRFAHAFFRTALYEEMIAARRLRLHQEVARALEAQYAPRREEHAAELAEHYGQSTDRADLAKAVEYSELAAKRAMAVFAYAEAEGHLRRCLEVQEVLDPEDGLRRSDLLLLLGDAILPQTEPYRLIASSASDAFALAEASSESLRAARASVQALDALMRTRGGQQSDEYALWVERADRHSSDGTRDRIYARLHFSVFHLSRGRIAPGHEYLRSALDEARVVGDNSAFFAAAGRCLLTLRAVRDRQIVRELSQEVIHRPREGVKSQDLAMCLLNGGAALFETGFRGLAEAAWTELADLASKTSDAYIAQQASTGSLFLAFADGRLEEVAQAPPIPGNPLSLLSFHAMSYLGRWDEALTGLNTQTNRTLASNRLAILARAGRNSDFSKIINGLFPDIGSKDDETNWAALVLLLESATLGGFIDAVRIIAPLLEPLSGEMTLLSGSVGRHLGSATILLQRADEARSLFAGGLDIANKLRHRPEIALTRLTMAELLLGHYPDERDAAIEHLDFAIAEFREMKMQPSLERALRHRGLLKA